MPTKDNKNGSNIFLYILLAGVLVAIIVSFYSFYYKKNYDFFIETECNPETETCFFRDCISTPDICPPNNLSYYNQYTIKAGDFKACINEDCTEACTTSTINCTKIECTDSDINDGTCVLPSNSNTEN